MYWKILKLPRSLEMRRDRSLDPEAVTVITGAMN
jgi:hypothetical protein